MEAARKPRLSLSRRKPPLWDGPPAAGSRGLQSPGDCAPWAEVLRAGSADLSADGRLPPLPAFPGQEPERLQPVPKPEVFTVGGEVFSWTPFPPARGGGGGGGGGLGRGRPYRVIPAEAELPGPRSCSPKLPAPKPLTADEQPSAQRDPALRSCPMCQVDFRPTLTQLDIDSHLAQCLAESTEDIVW
ncbi:Fanconi anemia core complex-associated protein 20 [Erinaceus europaeus]|uniref:Fanconi anemia core complex-associated protein 20 n=1 Tax=Erinaceus europaeus TaxID=9365 RepID=A0A1S3A5A4_ERIEU|nr:Fanconi anemia core complex-associated protein 20 [Erinaceus europaeus]